MTGRGLDELLTQYGVRGVQLARELGRHESAVSRWRTGSCEIDADEVPRIKAAIEAIAARRAADEVRELADKLSSALRRAVAVSP